MVPGYFAPYSGGDGEEFDDPVAVIGMAARLPGAGNVDEFWANLRDGVEAVSVFSEADLDAAGVSAADRVDPAFVRARPVIDGADLFDAGFFGYSPAEAAAIDPQHRLLLETAWAAVEAAGHDPRSLAGLAAGV